MSGRLIGRGRHADVFEHGPGTVLRRYRTGQSAEPEAALMAHARRHGFPCPAIVEASGTDMVMERVDGPSLLDVMVRRPHAMARHAAVLVDLAGRLHEIEAPAQAERPVGPGDTLLHLDLQPANIVVTDQGPVLLDWGWAAAGTPEADLAHTWVLMATSEVPGNVALRALATIGRRAFVRSYLRQLDRAPLLEVLPEVVGYRLDRRSLSDRERERVAAFSG